MNAEGTDPSRPESPLMGPAASPRAAADSAPFGSLADLLPPFAAGSRDRDAGAAATPDPIYEDFPWLADEGDTPIQSEARSAVEEPDPEPIGIETLEELEPHLADEPPVVHEPVSAAEELEPWEQPVMEQERPSESPALPDWFLDEGGVDSTAEWLLESGIDEPVELPADEQDPAPLLVQEPGSGVEEGAAPAPAAQAPVLTEVAERLERIARSLRDRTPGQIFDPQAESDPLQLLITGYAMGYAEAQRAAVEKRGK